MSSSYSCECELRKLAEGLHRQACELEEAANVLATIRDSEETKKKIEDAKEWAKEWMKR